MKVYAMSDIHGCLQEFEAALDALMEKLGMEEIIAKNMLQYIPQILLPKNQRKAKELLDECENV